MSLTPRVFMFNGQRLPDPDPTKTPQEIKDFYASQHPELTNATYVHSTEAGKDVYTFKVNARVKG